MQLIRKHDLKKKKKYHEFLVVSELIVNKNWSNVKSVYILSLDVDTN